MRSTPSPLSNGSLQPISIPELQYPPSSPSSADAGYPSPDSDTIMTPLNGQTLHTFPHSRSPPNSSLSAHGHVKISDSAARAAYNHVSPPCPPRLSPSKFEATTHYDNIYGPSRELDLLDESFETSPFASPFPDTPSSGSVEFTSPPLSPFLGSHLNACLYSRRFPEGHVLNVHFAKTYALGDELGAGGYGFVLTAHHRTEGHEVAVKFIIKNKVPGNAWVEEESIGRIPTEIMLLSLIDHDNIVKCLDVFEDNHYFYLVQELHGTPWKKFKEPKIQRRSSVSLLVPALSPSYSEDSMADSEPPTPPLEAGSPISHPQILEPGHLYSSPPDEPTRKPHQKLRPSLAPLSSCPKFSRRPSHDLFEFIEQSKHKRLTEDQARYIFAQVVEAVYYLDTQGISHRDIKDENLVIDSDLKVKLIDFGSAVISDPNKPQPLYELFLGTPAYAASEILMKRPYQAPQAEIWTLGVLLSYLLTGMSPFLKPEDAMYGRISLVERVDAKPSRAAVDLLRSCLNPDPTKRARIQEVRAHCWLRGELDASPPSLL